MKVFVVFASLLAIACAEHCYSDVAGACGTSAAALKNCNANYGAAHAVIPELQKYANAHISRNWQYMLMSTHFGNYERNRDGFGKLYRKLSDSTWNDAIDLIKYITKRGGIMDFMNVKEATTDGSESDVVEMHELGSLARALDIQKSLAQDAHEIHTHATRHRDVYHDPEVSSYLEKEFMHRQADTIRELAGHTNDLKQLIEGKSSSLAVFLFDEYLQKI